MLLGATRTKFESRIFEKVSATGIFQKQSPDDVTWRDKGELPLIPPLIDLEYQFEFGRLNINALDRKFTGLRASTNPKDPEKYFYDSRMDDLYEKICADLETARTQTTQNTALLERYPGLADMDPTERAFFSRMAVIQTNSLLEMPHEELEQAVTEAYEGSQVSLYPPSRQIKLKNKVAIEISYDITHDVAIILPPRLPKEKFEEMRDFFLNHELLKLNQPYLDTKNHHVYMCVFSFNFGEEGHPVLEQAFKSDIEQLPKTGPYQ